jgi:hypothetical protein
MRAEAVGLEPTSGAGRHPFSRRAPQPAGWLPCRTVPGAGIEPAASTFRAWRHDQPQLPRSSGRRIRTSTTWFKARQPAVSRFPRASRGCRTHLSGLGSPRLAARPGTQSPKITMRDRGVEPRSPGWKPGVLPLDQSRSQRKGRESNPQGSALARPRIGCRRPSACPSPISTGGRSRTSNRRLNRAPPYRWATPVSEDRQQSGWPDSNRRSPASEAGGLPGFPTP